MRTHLMPKGLIAGSSALALALALSSPAYAQQPAPPAEPESTIEADEPETLGQNEVELESGRDAEASVGQPIVVTGSRIRRPNLTSTVPITSVGPQELVERGDVSLGDALNELPALRSTFGQANSTAFIGTAGLNILDLRGLGTTRTLVLVNGRRHVTVQPGAYGVDVNTIPSDLLERVDVVTGGNSAIYGSDAVAGVVNFILKKDYEGVKVRGQSGISTYGDRGSYFVSAIAGKNLLDDRLNVAVAAEYAKSNPLFYSDRDYLGAYSGVPGFITSEITTAPNRNFNGIPNTVFVDGNPGITFGNISTGGYVLTTCPAPNATNAAQRALVCTGATTPTGGLIPYNFAFDQNGNLLRDDPSRGLVDNRGIGGGVLGGLSATGVEDAMLSAGLDRKAFNILLSGDFSPAFQPFLEAKYVKVNALQQSTQPTFVASNLNPVFSINNPFLSAQARATLLSIAPTATTFRMQRFNNDLGTRAEQHERDTYRVVVGTGGSLSERGNLRYEVALNYGRTETYYETGGNVDVRKFNNASNAVRNSSGQIVCAINADASTANDDPACVPINLFGLNAPSQAAKDYVLFTSSREQWAEQKNAVAFISGDTEGMFELPGGPIGAALGVEWRKESAYSAYDPYTTVSGNTFLNGSAPFEPPSQTIKEAFGELRLPLLRNAPFFEELTLEGSGRVSDYGGDTGAVWAYNAGATWSPVRDLRMRASYARSVRAPNLGNLYSTAQDTYANGLVDPCGFPQIQDNPNRARNCAAAGIPTTITYLTDAGVVTRPFTNVAGSGVLGVNQGNPDLVPEVGKSLTIGAVLQPRFLSGFSLSLDYYKIKIENVISGLSGQAIINRCYDDPVGLDNPFCAAVSRRSTADPLTNFTFAGQSSRRLEGRNDVVLPVTGYAFVNQPFNFAALKTSGVDMDAAYRTRLGGNTVLNLRSIVSYVKTRESFSYITQPDRSDQFVETLGDPRWKGSFSGNLDFGMFDAGLNMRYVGRQIVSGLGYETFFEHQGRQPTNPDARPFVFYKPVVYYGLRTGFEPTENFKFYAGVDNVTNELPPYDLTGTGSDAIYPNTGRFFYAGAEVKF